MAYADPEKRREYDRQWYAANREKRLESRRKWKLANPEKNRESVRRCRDKLRAQVLDLLGGKCARCGFDDRRVLQIDHINGGGTAEYKALSPVGILRKVLSDPTPYQLLCPTCNWLKRVERKEYRGRKKERMPSEDCVSGVPFRRQA